MSCPLQLLYFCASALAWAATALTVALLIATYATHKQLIKDGGIERVASGISTFGNECVTIVASLAVEAEAMATQLLSKAPEVAFVPSAASAIQALNATMMLLWPQLFVDGNFVSGMGLTVTDRYNRTAFTSCLRGSFNRTGMCLLPTAVDGVGAPYSIDDALNFSPLPFASSGPSYIPTTNGETYSFEQTVVESQTAALLVVAHYTVSIGDLTVSTNTMLSSIVTHSVINSKHYEPGTEVFITLSTGVVFSTTFKSELARVAACKTVSCVSLPMADSAFPELREVHSLIAEWNPPTVGSQVAGVRNIGGKTVYVCVRKNFDSAGLALFATRYEPVGSQASASQVIIQVTVVIAAMVLINAYAIVTIYLWFIKPSRSIINMMERVGDLEFDFLDSPGGESNKVVEGAAQLAVPQHEQPAQSGFSEMAELHGGFFEMAYAVRVFTRYVPREVIKELLTSKTTSDTVVGKILTIVFIDIANFTTMCESLKTTDLVELAEKYFDCLTRTLMSHGCTIDKYIGDAVMGFWGAPLDYMTQGFSACCATLHLQSAMTEAKAAFMEYGLSLAVRMGVHRGTVVVGNVGCTERLSYTALGENVNIASRLEAINKQFHSVVAISDTVLQDSLVEREPIFSVRRLGVLRSNKGGIVPFYQLIGVLHRYALQSNGRRESEKESASDNASSESSTPSGFNTHATPSQGTAISCKSAQLTASQEMSSIRPKFHVPDDADAIMQKLSLSQEKFEKGKFSEAEKLASSVLDESSAVLERFAVDPSQIRTAVQQYQMLQVHPPQDFDPCVNAH